MLGRTNSVQSGSGGAGETITAINMTDKQIKAGQKLWVNNETWMSEDFIRMVGSYDASSGYGLGFSQSGNYLYTRFGIYKLSGDHFSLVTDKMTTMYCNYCCTQGNAYQVFFGGSNIKVFKEDIGYLITCTSNDQPVVQTSGYISRYNDRKLDKYSLETGVLETSLPIRDTAGNPAYPATTGVVIFDNILYDIEYKKKYEIRDNEVRQIGSLNVLGSSRNGYIIGYTPDRKYIILSSGYMIQNMGNDTFVWLESAQLPFETKNLVGRSYCNAWYDAINNTLTYITGNQNKPDYLILQYVDDKWIKLPIELRLPTKIDPSNPDSRDVKTPQDAPLAIDKDLTRVAFMFDDTSGRYDPHYVYFENIKTSQGYSANNYSPYVVNDQTFIGMADKDAEPKEEVAVKVVLGDKTNLTVNVTNSDNVAISVE